MRLLFDTSTVIAPLLEDHPQHKFALSWLEKIYTSDTIGLLSTHSLAELYSVLSRYPRQPKLQPQDVQALLDNLTSLEKIMLEPQDYKSAIDRLVALQLTGGIIFDCLIAQAALKGNADNLITLNPKDFLRLGPDIAALVIAPT
jgi:predicted nucleic acid-binding protein